LKTESLAPRPLRPAPLAASELRSPSVAALLPPLLVCFFGLSVAAAPAHGLDSVPRELASAPPLLPPAATPGLPFVEDFTSTALRDSTRTTADWCTPLPGLRLSHRNRIFGAFGSGTIGKDIGVEAKSTVAVAFGDVDGDGDLDLVTGNYKQRCQYFPNNGTDDPWNGVGGIDITSDGHYLSSIALGDVDRDGDLDLVVGRAIYPNRLYLNNGTENPWSGVGGINITSDVHGTCYVVLGDVDGDQDLDLVVADRNQPSRLYLNNGTANPWGGVSGVNITNDSPGTTAVALGDVDRDGDLDLVVGTSSGSSRIYLNNGTADPWGEVTGTDVPSIGRPTEEIALGDVDGDGDLDLVNGGTGALKLFLNNGTSDPWGGVVAVTIDAWPGNLYTLTLGDVDGDGDLDLVTGTNFDERSRLYLNNGTANPWGGVGAIDITTDAPSTRAVALGDVDGDGDLDLVAGNQDQLCRLYLNEGVSGPWGNVAGRDITTDAQNTWAVALGDVDRDGDLDLVAGSYGYLFIDRLFLNNGTADPWNGVAGLDIGPNTDWPSTTSLALGDVDRDGDLDLVLGRGDPPSLLYLNNGTANPWGGVTGSNIGGDALMHNGVALGDVDRDGDLDLVAAVGNSDQLNLLYLNNGTADPWNGVTGTPIGTERIQTSAVALGDVDGDGDLDLVTGDRSFGNRLYLNNGTANPWNGVAATSITPEAFLTKSLALGDVDGDGDLDLVTGSAEGGGPIRFFSNNGTANPWNGVSGVTIVPGSPTAYSLALGDLDGDGDLDLVVGLGGKNRLYLNNGTANPWADVAGSDITSDYYVNRSVALGDVDGNGSLDLVAGTTAGYGVPNRLYLNNSSPVPWSGLTGSDIASDANVARSVAIGDVDRDGDLDLVTGNEGPNRLYLNNHTSHPWSGVTGVDITSDSDSTYSVALGDVDRDGDLDLVVGNGSQRNRLYLNNGTAAPWNGVAGSDITTDIRATRSVVLGDVDHDGDLDFVVGNDNQASRLYLNNGGADPWGGGVGVDITSDARATRSVALGDVDRDGDLDLVVGNDGQPNRLYLNNGTANPWGGAIGSDITSDARATRSVALGDVDLDGDLDLVVGNDGQPNRLYLNNGTANPWSGVSGSNITSDAKATRAVALIDVDRDGDLDLVTGNYGQPDRLYLNNGTANPWNGVTGSDITNETFNTTSVALADMNRDGIVEMLEGCSGQPIRYLERSTAAQFNPANAVGTSLEVDTRSANIPYAALTTIDSRPANSGIDYWLSNDGGDHWKLAYTDREVAFGTAFGNDLRWKAELRSLSPVFSPVVSRVSIDYIDHEPPAIDLLVPNGGETWAAGSTQTILWTASDNEGLAGFALDYRNEELPSPTWQPITCTTPPTGASRSCKWTLPTTTSTAMRVRITARDTRPAPGGPNTATDSSSGTFYVVQSNSDQIRTLVVWNEHRMRWKDAAGTVPRYPASDVDALKSALSMFRNHVKVDGFVLDLGVVPSLDAPYAAWEGTAWTEADQSDSTANVAAANALADAIRNYLYDRISASFPGLVHLVVVGGDGQIPFFRMADSTSRQPESRYVGELQQQGFLGGTPNTDFCDETRSPIWAALCTDRYLSDTKYGASTEKPVPGSTRSWWLPDVSVGRLVETPAQIAALVDAYVAQDGVTVVDEVLTTGYDFLTDGGDAASSLLAGSLDLGATTLTRLSQSDSTPPNPFWTDTDLEERLFGMNGKATADLSFLSGHADHRTEGAAAAGFAGGLTTTEMSDDPSNRGGVVVGIGCHSALSLDGAGNPTWDDLSPELLLDLPELMATKKIPVFVGNGGYGWGLSEGVGLGEQLLLLTADEIVRAGQIGVGEALRLAKQEYFLRQDRLDAFDHKVLHESILFGIPNYEVRVRKATTLAATREGSWFGADSDLTPEQTRERLSTGPRVPGRPWLGDPAWKELDLGEGRRLTKGEIVEISRPAAAGPEPASGASLRIMEFEYQAFDAVPPAWQPDEDYALDRTIRPTTANGHVYRTTVAGRSGSSEPAWPTNAGGSVTSGTATFTETSSPWPNAYERFDMCADSTGETVFCSGGGGAPGTGETRTGTFFTLDRLASDNPGQPLQPMISFDSKLFGTELHGILMKGGAFVEPREVNPATPGICTDENGVTRGCFDPVVGNPETKGDEPEGPAPTPFLAFSRPTPFLAFSRPTPFLAFSRPTPNGFDEASLSSGGDPIRFDTLNSPMGETVRRGVRGTAENREEIVAQWLYRTREFTQFYSQSTDWTPPEIGSPTATCFDFAPWRSSTPYSPGDLVQPTVPNGHLYWTSGSGTSGSSEPTWPTGHQATVGDNDLTWQETEEAGCYSTRSGLTVDFDVPVTDSGDGVYKVFVTYNSDVDSDGTGAWHTLELSSADAPHYAGSIAIPRTTSYMLQAVDWAGNVGTVLVTGQDVDANGVPIGSEYSLPRLYTVDVPPEALLDADGDGMPDLWEDETGLDKGSNDAGLDPDDDGLSNREEFLAGTDPFDTDTDDDGDNDGSEKGHGRNPLSGGDGRELVVTARKSGGDVVLDWSPDLPSTSGPFRIHRGAAAPLGPADFRVRIGSGGNFTDVGGATLADGLVLYDVSNVGPLGPAPRVDAIVPAGGARAGGNSVSIYGDGFVSGSAGSLGGVPCTVSTFVNESRLVCKAPAASEAGVVTVGITLPDGRSATKAEGYGYLP
jgi:hypothetical protein